MQPIIFVISVLFMASVFLFAVSSVPRQSDVSKRLEEMEGLQWEQKSGGRANFLANIFSEAQRSELKQQLMEAGWYHTSTTQIIARSLSGSCFGLCVGLLVCVLTQTWSFLYLLLTGMLTVGGLYLPFSQIKSSIKNRKMQLLRGLPDFLDMLSSTVQAGLAFNAALNYAIDVTSGALQEEMLAVISEIRLGRSRADALKSMSSRVRQQDISAMVTSIVQAERLGSNLGKVLTELAEEARNKRMMRAEEIAAMMPVKMVLPMAAFMLPALFVMIFGGVVARYMSGG